jgi:hypothetical protein
MCLIQLPAFLAIILILARGRYSAHPIAFWCVVIFGLLAAWSWSVTRTGKHHDAGGNAPLVFEVVTSCLAIASVIASVVGIVVSFR